MLLGWTPISVLMPNVQGKHSHGYPWQHPASSAGTVGWFDESFLVPEAAATRRRLVHKHQRCILPWFFQSNGNRSQLGWRLDGWTVAIDASKAMRSLDLQCSAAEARNQKPELRVRLGVN